MTKLSIGIHGAGGRMGRRLVQLIIEDPTTCLGAVIEHGSHPCIGQDAGQLAGIEPLGVPLQTLSGWEGRISAMIDFSKPEATLDLAEVCKRRGIPLVVGTTGFGAEQKKALEAAASSIPILISPNMSRAVNLLVKLVAEAATALAGSADIEIIERHHRMKRDAPSGTALRLAEVASQSSGVDRFVHGREGIVGERPRNEIGIHAIRTADSPGDHTVIFGLAGESLELTHRALNRDGFVRGAIEAARFLANKPPRLYTMADVLANG